MTIDVSLPAPTAADDRGLVAQTVPPNYASVTVDVDLTGVQRLCDRVQADFRRTHDAPIDHLPFVFRAVMVGFAAYPQLAATIDDAGIAQIAADPHLQIGVKSPDGPKFPVVRSAANLSVTDLALELARYAKLAIESRLASEDLRGGSFSVLDYGARGILFGSPCVVRPQVAILGVGQLLRRPSVIGDRGLDTITIRDRAYLSLGYDTRHVDGPIATRFLDDLRTWLENTGPNVELHY
ncbi:MAG: 2-oxo acid dehydrogenase subunit E2 [Propionibacteriaceae bacterium]|jgi:2-oxoglutarate dehydrogenase E2 component (dihydrolipoamide succinyltransferase)|nr:2-oxo acid dehydrogenase subunit E2 [Propionibacteriaceae bacterium]